MLVRILKAWYKLFLVVHIALPPSAGGLSPGNFYIRGTKTMRELSLFVDESGDKSIATRYYLLTFVLHEQSDRITSKIQAYEQTLAAADLPNISFHSEPLLNGHDDYENLGLTQRKKLLVSFNVLVQRLPIQYKTFLYKRSEFPNIEKLAARMRRDASEMIADHLAYFQGFDHVKLYYDNGQAIVKKALDEAIYSILSKEAVVKKRTTMTEYRLAQVADYLCTIELAAVKYAAKENGATYDKFFGGVGSFKKNWLKQARRKMLRS